MQARNSTEGSGGSEWKQKGGRTYETDRCRRKEKRSAGRHDLSGTCERISEGLSAWYCAGAGKRQDAGAVPQGEKWQCGDVFDHRAYGRAQDI